MPSPTRHPPSGGVFDAHVHYWEAATRQRPHSDLGMDLGPPVSVESVLKAAGDAGVSRIIQVTPSCMGFDNRYALEGAERFPDVVRVFGRIDPTSPDAVERVTEWHAHPLAAGIRLTLHRSPTGWAEDREWRPFWCRCAALGVPVAVYAPDRAGELRSLAKAHPELLLIVDHCALGHPRGSFEHWDEILDLSLLSNVFMKVSHFPETAVSEGYPFKSGQRRLREVYERFGADRMIWGSNFPPVLSACSYAQALSFVRDECDFFSGGDRDKVLGGTLERVLGESSASIG